MTAGERAAPCACVALCTAHAFPRPLGSVFRAARFFSPAMFCTNHVSSFHTVKFTARQPHFLMLPAFLTQSERALHCPAVRIHIVFALSIVIACERL